MSVIKNKEELCSENTELRKDALAILEAGLAAIDTGRILRQKIKLEEGALNIDGQKVPIPQRIFFVGVGKCALDGARVIEDILGDHLTQGMVIDVRAGILQKIKSYVGTHPYPSEANIRATQEILKMVDGVTPEDLVLVLVSGGGSSLLCSPHQLSPEDFAKITEELNEKGADIYELNTVRKHLSNVHGGGLAKLLFPARIVSLIFSDVLGNDISVVSSGPTVPDKTTMEDAKNVLEKYGVNVDPSVLIETPKEEKYFANTHNFLTVSNIDALSAIKSEAERLGYKATIETETLSGNATKVGREIAQREIPSRTCLIFGGETTVAIDPRYASGGAHPGRGGRNQELALSALPYVREGALLCVLASDGFDNTDHAGAIADKFILDKARNFGLDAEKFLATNDSYNFWESVGGAIYTGRLGSNVSDLVILITK